MGIIKRAGDLVYTFRFLKLLVTDFKDTDAFKMGIIDADGKRNKEVEVWGADMRDVYTPFHKLVYNIKKLIAKAPGGSSKLASYAAALYLLKEKYGVSEKKIIEALEHNGTQPLLVENPQWFLLDDRRLSPGSYKLKNSKLLNITLDEAANEKDLIRVDSKCYPIGNFYGIDVYEAIHTKTNQKVYVTISELTI
tara:strand:- start:507 stop:1088 length:582 start_codon:yes stop_codon:yes gene_type:complete